MIKSRSLIKLQINFFWANKTDDDPTEEHWRRLIEIKKECHFNTVSAEDILISKYMTAITYKKLRHNMMQETTLEIKKIIALIKQDTYEKSALIAVKEEQAMKENPIQTIEKFGTRPKNNFNGNRPCRFCNAPKWNPLHKRPALESNCNKCGKEGHYAEAYKQRMNNNRTMRKLTEGEINEPKESLSESNESINYMEERETIGNKQNIIQRCLKSTE